LKDKFLNPLYVEKNRVNYRYYTNTIIYTNYVSQIQKNEVPIIIILHKFFH